MYYDKKKYEQLILESSLFSFDREKDSTAFRKESYKMVEYLYCYLLSINEWEYEPYGCEIMEVALRCISNFDSEKGAFLHYFMAAWKKEYSHIVSRNMQDQKYHGIRVTEEDKRAVIKYIRFAEDCGTDCTIDKLYQKIAKAMDISVEKVRELAQLSELSVSGDSYKGDDGGEESIWDLIPGVDDLDGMTESSEGISKVLEKIDIAFCSIQERQKPIISDMITIKIMSMFEELPEAQYSFLSMDIIREWRDERRVPTQRDIAEKYGRNEASVSRTVKKFLEKIKEN